MKKKLQYSFLLPLISLLVFLFVSCEREVTEKSDYVLVIHGGAGKILKENISDKKEALYRETLTKALTTGQKILENGGSSIDAVEQVIRVMEDSPLFNAGKGSVFNERGRNEMDAAIMDGKNLDAGAIAGVKRIRNPISAARAVMDKSKHVLLIKQGAEILAEKAGLEIVDSSYFFVQSRYDFYKKAKEAEKHGTVGCVALDKNGNLAAGTSTGGMTNKMFGRVGDSPIIGAGTYANNKTCAVSATGHGEFFIRNVVAYDISALMEYSGMSLNNAAEYVIQDKLMMQNASGGIIAVDSDGNIAMEFNTAGMFRGFVSSEAESEVLIFGE